MSGIEGDGGNGGKFGEYAKILRLVFERWISIRGQLRDEKLNEEAEELILPSNEDWRQRVYYGLVELQRECDAEVATNRVGEVAPTMEFEKNKEIDEEKEEEGEKKRNIEKETGREEETEKKWKAADKSRDSEWDPQVHGSLVPKTKESGSIDESKGSETSVGRVSGSMTEACVKPGWRVNDIISAAKVLQGDSTSLVYSDEAEMRRVFGLVYDVLRYKKIFIRSLEEVGFWQRNGALKNRRKIVWLLLYDMQGRKFSRRGEIAAVEERERVFQTAGLMDIEAALLESKTHLAASISRLRIRGSALTLGELLPARLRVIEGVAWGGKLETAAFASGWVNSNKFANKQRFLEEMSTLNLVLCENGDVTEMSDTGFAFHSICPKVVELHEELRETLARSTLVRDHRFVFLEKSLCFGAAAVARAMRVGRFCGPVVLTHALAPRHTGYLAELLRDIEDAGRLLAFGAGERRREYESYLNELGVTSQRCRVFSEKYVSPPATSELERATVVLAIPPCSYTGVRDIVDLAVARGGDTDLLESLTDAYTADDGDGDARESDRSRSPHLADQMSTLKHALTRPNVQFVIYEAHTILPSETTEMIRRVVDYANRMAVARHVRDQSSKKRPPKEAGESRESEKLEQPKEPKGDEDRAAVTVSANFAVPDSDLFEVGTIDDIYGENVSRALDPGCFLAVIRRKEMMQFDSLFMIKVAESKGLFGDPNERRERKRESVPVDRPARPPSLPSPRKRTKRFEKIELERLMAHTHCSLTRTLNEHPVCSRQERARRASKERNESRVREMGDIDKHGYRRRRRKYAATLVNVSFDGVLACESTNA
ncbi:uncharacterized protein LOC116430442 [Nomia melanderi]|uniref:uncharacterized protein LOC116430442 n=1 Tax=Nomia melanderi TaxID=2448451 RepID=UPI003FCD470F